MWSPASQRTYHGSACDHAVGLGTSACPLLRSPDTRRMRPTPAPQPPKCPTSTTGTNPRSEAGQVQGAPQILLSHGQDTGLQNKHNLGFTSKAEVLAGEAHVPSAEPLSVSFTR